MEQVITCCRCVFDDPHGLLSTTTTTLTAYPGDVVIAPCLFHLALCGNDIPIAARCRRLPTFRLCSLHQAIPHGRVSHPLRHVLARQFGLIKIHPPLEHTVTQQVVEAWVSTLNNHRRERCHCTLSVLYDIPHHVLETCGSAVELVRYSRPDIEIPACRVHVPTDPNSSAMWVVPSPCGDRKWRGTADVVVEAVGRLGNGALTGGHRHGSCQRQQAP